MEALLERINNAIESLGCVVNQDNADEIREAIRTLVDCKLAIKEK